ncbi:phage-related integrase [Xanthomonas euroxanthea]|uniref:Phage-related integrase n=1 Tax=Xanthomonas euroxanthea TaxID=2259622 RepID=A0AA46C7T3_9XANT|nr:phage-related integrase [Xanthomonas euroxanthea]
MLGRFPVNVSSIITPGLTRLLAPACHRQQAPGRGGKNWPKAKRGFHSLRKTVIQELQGAGVVSELRAQLVGHELDDEHHVTYSRAFTAKEKLDGLRAVSPGLSVLAYGLNLDSLSALMNQTT